MNKLLSSLCLACSIAAILTLLPLDTAYSAVKERVYDFDDAGAVIGQLPAVLAGGTRRGTNDIQESTTDYGGVDAPSNVNNSLVPMIGSSITTRIPLYANAADRPGASPGNLGLEFDGVDDTLYASKIGSTLPYFFDPRDFNSRFEVLSQAWVKSTATSFPSNQFVWRIGDEHGGVYASTNGKWSFRVANDTPPFAIESNIAVQQGVWTHLALLRGGNFTTFYVNGAIAGRDGQTWGHEGPDLRLGSDLLAAAGTFFKGVVDNFNIGTLSDELYDPIVDIDYYSDLGLEFSGTLGDIDQDGDVNNDDYQIWSQNVGFDNGFGVGDPTTLLKGDANQSGLVDIYDFLIINDASIAAGNGALGLAVPEPTSLTLLLMGAALIAGRRTRHRSLPKRRSWKLVLTAALLTMISANAAQAVLVVAEDFLYDAPSKLLGYGGGFNGYEFYQGGQNGPAGTWGGRWQNQSDGIIATSNYIGKGDPPVFEPNTPHNVGMPDGNQFGANSIIMRDFSLAGSVSATQTLYFGGKFKSDLLVYPQPRLDAPRLYLNRIRGADATSAGTPRDGSEDIAIGFDEELAVVRLGNVSDNFGFEATATVATNPPNDGNWHNIVGKLEVNVAGGANERLTVWVDPTGVETGGTSVQLERDIITDLSELLGTFDAQAINYTNPPVPEMGRVYVDDLAIGTAWQDVLNVSIPRLTLKINRTNNSGTLINSTSSSLDLIGYSIESTHGSLNASGWNSLDDQNVSNWLQNVSTANKLLETNFQGSTVVAPGGQLPLGGLFNAGGNEDLSGRITTADGLVNLLNVVYVTEAVGVAGDYNNDGTVDAADYTKWRDNLNKSVTLPNDSTPGTVTTDDYNVWKANFGASGGSGSGGASGIAVPEPSTLCMLLLVAVVGVVQRRRAE